MLNAGVGHVNLMGYNPSASSTAQTVWAVGSGTYAQLTTGTALEAVSGSANDAAAGTGARTIRVQGIQLDATTGTYLPFAETVTLNGTNAVALANTTAVAINSVEILTAGSGLTNAGDIDIRTVSGSTVKTRMEANIEAVGKTRDFIYTTSNLVYGLLKRIQVYMTGSTGDIWVYLNSYNSSGVKKVLAESSFALNVTAFASGPFTIDFGEGVYIPKQTLIELRVDVSAGTPVVNATGELILHAV